MTVDKHVVAGERYREEMERNMAERRELKESVRDGTNIIRLILKDSTKETSVSLRVTLQQASSCHDFALLF